MQDFFANLMNASFDLAAIGAWISELYNSVVAHADIAAIIDTATSYVQMLHPALTAGIYILLSLLVVFFGKKLLGVMKFFGFFAVGYGLGVFYLHAPIQTVLADVPSWVIGLVVGAVAALLCALLYLLTYLLGSTYVFYLILLTGAYLPEAIAAVFKGNMVISIAVAAGLAVVVMLLRKWVEMLGTAMLGGWLTYLSINSLLSATLGYGVEGIEAVAPYVTIIMWSVIGIFTLLGFIVQVRTRRRY